MTIEVGSIIKGTIVKIADYGAIVRLVAGKTGLIHISEIADTYVRDVRDYFDEEDEVTVKVLRLNNKGRYELSIKQCDIKLPPKSERKQPVGATAPGNSNEPRFTRESRIIQASPPPKQPVTFEDRLSRFLKDSEERQHDLKRNLESKRGRR